MSSKDSSVIIQTSSQSLPSTPSWFGEVAVIAHYLEHLGVFSDISERVRFARRWFGRYDLIDFAVVLLGYAISGERTLEAFYERVLPFAHTFMALFGRERLPHRSTLSRFLAALDQALIEAFRVLRKQNRYDALDQRFHLGSHVEGRDATAVRKTVSSLLKILHPDGAFTSDELQEYLELALEGRRRIKEQLKKRGAFEFYKTSFSYIDLADGIERTVGVPEQGAKGAISQDPLPPGTVYTATANGESHVALYRLEVTLTAGTGKLRTPAGMEHGLKESLNRAWSYLKVVQDRLGLASTLAQKDLIAEAIDLSGGHVECACGVAFLVAMLSALGQRRVQAGTLVLGDLTIQGNIKALPSIIEILQMALENGALRVLLPTGNKVQFSSLPEEVVEKVDIIFYSDVDRAITKAVEM